MRISGHVRGYVQGEIDADVQGGFQGRMQVSVDSILPGRQGQIEECGEDDIEPKNEGDGADTEPEGGAQE